MTYSVDLARVRAIAYSDALVKRRLPAARRARWRNSYANFKKLIVKKRRAIAVGWTVFCLGIGGVAGYSKVLNPFVNVSDQSVTTIYSTPVAASGDETLPSLKLSTELLLTKNLPGKMK